MGTFKSHTTGRDQWGMFLALTILYNKKMDEVHRLEIVPHRQIGDGHFLAYTQWYFWPSLLRIGAVHAHLF